MLHGVLNAVKSGKETEWEWKIQNFSLSEGVYRSPCFEFEDEAWFLHLNTGDSVDGYMELRLVRLSVVSPIKVEISVSVKTTEGAKIFDRPERNCFESGRYYYSIKQWISKKEFSNRQSELLSSGCFTILITMKRADAKESESASAAAASSCTKESHQGDKISIGRKFLNKLVKCSVCDEVVSLNNWFYHECQISNAKAARSESKCSCCKERLHEEKIAFHKECLNKEAKCRRCEEVVNLQNWFDHVCQTENGPAAANTSEISMVSEHDKILQDLRLLLLNQEHSDVVLRVEGKQFPAHKAILAARSSVFASTFRHEMKENKTGIVDIEGCDPSVFPDFLCFLYCNGTSNLSGENVFGLFTIADKYDCEELRVKCVHFIKDNLTVETFCKALALALLYSEAELLRVATDFFIENAGKILVTVDWQKFAAENPTQSNELFVKYVNSTTR